MASPHSYSSSAEQEPAAASSRIRAFQKTRKHRQLREILDKGARGIVWVGGISTILSIMGIFVYLLIEVAPLFSSAKGHIESPVPVKIDPLTSPTQGAVGVDEYREVAYVINGKMVTFFDIPSMKTIPIPPDNHLADQHISVVTRAGGKSHEFGLGTMAGQVIPVEIILKPNFSTGKREILPGLTSREPIQAVPDGSPISRLAYQKREEGTVIAAWSQQGQLWVTKVQESEGLMLSEELLVSQVQLVPQQTVPVNTILVDGFAENVYVGLENGQLLHWDLRNFDEPRLVASYQIKAPEDAITALSYLIGDRTLVVGTRSGTVSTWMPLRNFEHGGILELHHVHDFSPHKGAVTQISPSQRDKGFITADTEGTVTLHHSTSGQSQLTLQGAGPPIVALMFAPKTDGGILLDESTQVQTFSIHNPHPEITFSTLFFPIWYEGYEHPEYIWQSSSGSDDFEPKYGMIPLIFGTLKGTIYAMILAIPLAVMGAIYTAMFMPPKLRSIVKPVIEIMAALPSVVLGFLAGLWLAPLLEGIFPAVVAMVITVPAGVAIVSFAWHVIPGMPSQGKAGVQLLVITTVIVTTIAACLALNDSIESWVFCSDYKKWFNTVLGMPYDQRNALVISFAMGFAVIPIIFSISEDSISNVPRHLIAGSLAMGATQWQTLTRLVLISASPGIFSALMIGFGRAVGETMIVLMATGNTPILDWSVFNGFRTLSANIAVEMPEAPHGGTLYRVLFLSGLILFAFTFSINTVAELIRQRLRAKYSQY